MTPFTVCCFPKLQQLFLRDKETQFTKLFPIHHFPYIVPYSFPHLHVRTYAKALAQLQDDSRWFLSSRTMGRGERCLCSNPEHEESETQSSEASCLKLHSRGWPEAKNPEAFPLYQLLSRWLSILEPNARLRSPLGMETLIHSCPQGTACKTLKQGCSRFCISFLKIHPKGILKEAHNFRCTEIFLTVICKSQMAGNDIHVQR